MGNDPEKDVEGAKRAGLKVVLVDRDHSAADSEVKADFRADDLRHAWRWIETNS